VQLQAQRNQELRAALKNNVNQQKANTFYKHKDQAENLKNEKREAFNVLQ
jgi:hypothetical protein